MAKCENIQMWWHMPLVVALRGLRQEGCWYQDNMALNRRGGVYPLKQTNHGCCFKKRKPFLPSLSVVASQITALRSDVMFHESSFCGSLMRDGEVDRVKGRDLVFISLDYMYCSRSLCGWRVCVYFVFYFLKMKRENFE